MSRIVVKSPNLIKRGILSFTAVTGGCIIGLGCYAKNTLLVKQYKKFTELHGADGPIEPSLKLMDMVNDVNEELKEFVSEYTPINACIIPGLNTIHNGTVGSFQGGLIGLPFFFDINRKEEIEGKIKWDQRLEKDGQDVYDAFLLSDEAKKYGIAREILLVNTVQAYINTVLPMVLPFAVYQITSSGSIYSEVAKLPLLARVVFYGAITVFGLFLWRLIHNNIKLYYEKKIEVDLSKLGEHYIRGGLEYNSKAVQRSSCSAEFKDQKNRILKAIGDNIKSLNLIKELPVTYKVEFYKQLLQTEKSQLKTE